MTRLCCAQTNRMHCTNDAQARVNKLIVSTIVNHTKGVRTYGHRTHGTSTICNNHFVVAVNFLTQYSRSSWLVSLAFSALSRSRSAYNGRGCQGGKMRYTATASVDSANEATLITVTAMHIRPRQCPTDVHLCNPRRCPRHRSSRLRRCLYHRRQLRSQECTVELQLQRLGLLVGSSHCSEDLVGILEQLAQRPE